jgi:hypothetical protein
MSNYHGLSDAIFEIKDKLTDGEFKRLMELCKADFDDKKNGLYEIEILSTMLNEESEDDDDDDMNLKDNLKLRFTKLKIILQLSDEDYKSCLESDIIDKRLLEGVIDLSIFTCRDFPIDIAELPLLSITRIR